MIRNIPASYISSCIFPFIFILGLIFGSFVNVLIHRIPIKESFVFPRSRCPKCRHIIAAYDNFPLLSFLWLRGKCRHCHAPISLQYPLVELLTASLFVAAAYQFGVGWELLYYHWPWLIMLVAIAFIDLHHEIIPDIFSLGGTLLGIAVSHWVLGHSLTQALIGAGAGFGIFYGFSYLYYFMTGKIGLGGGDIKFLMMVGAYLGFAGVFVTILFSSITGSLVGLIWALRSKRRKKSLMKFRLPYGPFLVLAALIYYFFRNSSWLQFIIPI